MRVVFCDAAAYDAGYLPAEDVAGRAVPAARAGLHDAAVGVAQAAHGGALGSAVFDL